MTVTDASGKDGLLARFKMGLARGKDPANAPRSGRARTTTDSEWLPDNCPRCRHNFRLDDEVIVDYGPDRRLREVRHDNPLWCGEPTPGRARSQGSTIAERFFAGIDRTNPPPAGIRVFRLRPGSPLLADRRDRQRCRVCAGTFRPLELVVICPCSPQEPLCQFSVHRDPARGLTCFDEWLPEARPTRCPMNYRRIGEGDGTLRQA